MKKRTRYCRYGFLITVLLLQAACLRPGRTTEEKIAAIENRLLPDGAFPPWRTESLAARMEHYRVPGLGMAVIENYELVWARGYGVIESGTGRPVTTDTLFPALGNSSIISGYAAMILMERKRLAPDDKVQQALRSWQIPGNESGVSEVTVRLLLRYDAAGLNEFDLKGYERDKSYPDLRQVLEGAPPAANPPVRLLRQPGTAPRRDRVYLTSHIVLQQLLEDIEGRPYPALAADVLFAPMGLRASTFEQPLPEARWSEAVTCHDGDRPLPGKWLVYPEAAAMGLWTTPSELARLAGEIAKSYRGLSARFVSRETAAGNSNVDYPFNRQYSSVRGCESDILFNPNTGEGFVLMMNSGPHGGSLRDEILHTVFTQYRWTWGQGLIWSDTFKQGWMLTLAMILLILIAVLMAILDLLEHRSIPHFHTERSEGSPP